MGVDLRGFARALWQRGSFSSRAGMLAGAALALMGLLPWCAQAQPAGQLPLLVGSGSGGTSFSVPIQTLLFFTALSFLPAILLMMTGFTRIVIVLSLLRQALGTQSAPPNQVVVGLSLFLTFFVMGPTFDRIYEDAYLPYSTNAISFEQAMAKADPPIRLCAVCPAGQAGFERDGRDGSPAHSGAGLCHQRAEDRVPDRFHDLHPVSGDRHGGLQHPDVPGHDDAVTGVGGVAVQIDAFRAGRRLEPHDWLARSQLCKLRKRQS